MTIGSRGQRWPIFEAANVRLTQVRQEDKSYRLRSITAWCRLVRRQTLPRTGPPGVGGPVLAIWSVAGPPVLARGDYPATDQPPHT